jgi:hypothetical protein
MLLLEADWRSTRRLRRAIAFSLSGRSTLLLLSTSGLWRSGSLAYDAAGVGLLSPDLAAGIRRVKGAKKFGVWMDNG